MTKTSKKFLLIAAMVAAMATTAAFAAPQEAHSWEELQRLCRVQLAPKDNHGNPTNDGGKLGYLRWDAEWRITDEWRVFSGSTVERRSGEVLPAGSEFYAWYLGGNSTPSPTPVTPADGLITFSNLSQYGKVVQRDSLWMEFVPYQDCRIDLAVFACFDQDNFSNEVVGLEGQAASGALRQGGHYLLAVRELFKSFVPEDEKDFDLLSHPKNGGARWRETRRPEGHVYECYTVDNLAADWAVAPNCYVLSNSEIRRAAGEIIAAGSEVFLYIEYRNASPEKGGSGDSGGGGGCDAGFGLPALALVGLALKKRR